MYTSDSFLDIERLNPLGKILTYKHLYKSYFKTNVFCICQLYQQQKINIISFESLKVLATLDTYRDRIRNPKVHSLRNA